MIYLLSGLLVIHGIVCLLGALFPFYPPVYFFYVFFPGHFAIRLVIVLFVGSAQIAYGMYLALRQRWQIRWHWPAIATIVITGLLLVYTAMQSPGLFGASAEKGEIRQPILVKEMFPSLTGPEAPDDIIPAPGMGPAYRANIHQQGVENPWPPIDTTKITLGSSFETDTVYVRYRDYIETEARASRNNIVFISMGNRAVGSLKLYIVNLPTGIEVTEGMRWHGPGPVSVVLVMEISPDAHSGQYSFGIGIEVDGKDYSTVPCTIKVSNLNTITIYPEPGGYLGTDDKLSELILLYVQIRKEVCDKDYFSPWFPAPKKVESCLVVSGHIQNLDRQRFEIAMSALGYDEIGERVAGTVDAAHISGAIGLHLEYEEMGEFTMHLNYSERVKTIQISAVSSLIPPP